jgi:coatomer protein complex subunit gamma
MGILGMHPCEGTEVVPGNARSHTVLLAGELPGGCRALVRLLLGMDASGQVAMKVVSRAQDEAGSEAVHSIIQEA